MSDSAALLTVPPVKAPKKDRRKSKSETACAVLSDLQLGKETSTYNSEVCEERIENYGDKVVRLAEIQRQSHPVNDCRVWLLGDNIEGEAIFPGQPHEIDSSLYQQLVVNAPRILINFIRKMLANFDTVHVAGVIGNHGAVGGRSRKEYHRETNFDRMLYRIVQMVLEEAGEDRVTFDFPDKAIYTVDAVGDRKFLLFHGHNIRGWSGIPWYGVQRIILPWQAGSLGEDFDYALFGHFHTPASITLKSGIRAWANGTPESDNEYAQEQLAASGHPAQWLLFTHPERGVTCEYLVTDLD